MQGNTATCPRTLLIGANAGASCGNPLQPDEVICKKCCRLKCGVKWLEDNGYRAVPIDEPEDTTLINKMNEPQNSIAVTPPESPSGAGRTHLSELPPIIPSREEPELPPDMEILSAASEEDDSGSVVEPEISQPAVVETKKPNYYDPKGLPEHVISLRIREAYANFAELEKRLPFDSICDLPPKQQLEIVGKHKTIAGYQRLVKMGIKGAAQGIESLAFHKGYVMEDYTDEVTNHDLNDEISYELAVEAVQQGHGELPTWAKAMMLFGIPALKIRRRTDQDVHPSSKPKYNE
jgi:hypothetical protein